MNSNGATLVTGASGYIGQHLLQHYFEKGVDSKAYTRSAKPEYLKNINWIQGDILDYDNLSAAMEGCSKVVHLACSSLNQSYKNLRDDFLVNAMGTINVLQAALETNITQVVYLSTAQVYGKSKRLPLAESMQPKPDSPYARSKLIGEDYCQIYSTLNKLSTIVLRVFNVYGNDISELQRSSVENIFIQKLKANESITVTNSDESRDFVHVRDVVRAINWAFDLKVHHDIFNIGSGVETKIIDLARMLKDLAKSNVEIIQKDEPLQYRLQADVSKAKQFGFRTKADLKKSLTQLYMNETNLDNTKEV